ncbi:hypothetical protein CSOJ01_07661 [Colletotrichum sojae]|uniref:AB hydrolase-1 domain-containing protein n=1 Tax=Colletotrichum sojae TaxID=2175907 RepID=A0A8H6MU00_9PEZI|nr:hypothetical protein CSOJ01_07661 [Colletotrichum sojae]
MEPFRLTLSNDAVVSGLSSISHPKSSSTDHRPLIVGLHGGTYESQYFDATPRYSASIPSLAFGVPFVAIDRPSYRATSSLHPIPNGSDFPQETGIWLHRYILPKLWTEFGVPNRCNSVVLLCHSLGVMGGVVAASLHARDEKPLYPLGGLIASGLGDTHKDPSFTEEYLDNEDLGYETIPVASKDAIMFPPGTAPAEIFEQSQRLNTPTPRSETALFKRVYLRVWKEKYAVHIKVPVMFALVDDDSFFVVNEQELKTCAGAFRNSPRVDVSLVPGAPHCMEISYWSQGWYARCFGFSMECAAHVAWSSGQSREQ